MSRYLCRSIQYHTFTKSPCSGFVSPQLLGTISRARNCAVAGSTLLVPFSKECNVAGWPGNTYVSGTSSTGPERADCIVQCSHWHSSPLNKCVEIKSAHCITHTFKVQYGWGYTFTQACGHCCLHPDNLSSPPQKACWESPAVPLNLPRPPQVLCSPLIYLFRALHTKP